MHIVFSLALVGLLPAYIASRKGENFALWWIYGAILIFVALPHALLLEPAVGSEKSTCKNAALLNGAYNHPRLAECATWTSRTSISHHH
ncbi:MAG: hypothetical protein ABWZ80_05300 [Beijerinckiaceae bacterium]